MKHLSKLSLVIIAILCSLILSSCKTEESRPLMIKKAAAFSIGGHEVRRAHAVKKTGKLSKSQFPAFSEPAILAGNRNRAKASIEKEKPLSQNSDSSPMSSGNEMVNTIVEKSAVRNDAKVEKKIVVAPAKVNLDQFPFAPAIPGFAKSKNYIQSFPAITLGVTKVPSFSVTIQKFAQWNMDHTMTVTLSVAPTTAPTIAPTVAPTAEPKVEEATSTTATASLKMPYTPMPPENEVFMGEETTSWSQIWWIIALILVIIAIVSYVFKIKRRCGFRPAKRRKITPLHQMPLPEELQVLPAREKQFKKEMARFEGEEQAKIENANEKLEEANQKLKKDQSKKQWIQRYQNLIHSPAIQLIISPYKKHQAKSAFKKAELVRKEEERKERLKPKGFKKTVEGQGPKNIPSGDSSTSTKIHAIIAAKEVSPCESLLSLGEMLISKGKEGGKFLTRSKKSPEEIGESILVLNTLVAKYNNTTTPDSIEVFEDAIWSACRQLPSNIQIQEKVYRLVGKEAPRIVVNLIKRRKAETQKDVESLDQAQA